MAIAKKKAESKQSPPTSSNIRISKQILKKTQSPLDVDSYHRADHDLHFPIFETVFCVCVCVSSPGGNGTLTYSPKKGNFFKDFNFPACQSACLPAHFSQEEGRDV